MTFDEKILLRLKKYLDRINYHLLLTITLGEEVYFVNPLPEYMKVKQNLLKLPEKYRSIVSFFFLGEPISKDIAEMEIGNEVMDYLYDLNIVNRDGMEYWLNNYLLTSYSNSYIFVANVYYYPTCQSKEQKPYIGIDSYWLSRLVVNRLHGRVLDLCTGSGIQAIIAGKIAEKVIAVDIDPESARIAAFNVCLNGLKSKIEVLTGNLYDVLDVDDKFDFIISNPPFIPIPNSVNFHICGDGGEDGVAVIRDIIRGYKRFLKSSGETIMIGQCMGTFEHALIQDVVEEENPNKEYSIYLCKKTILESQAVGFAELASIYNGEKIVKDMWRDVYKEKQMSYLHNFSLFTQGADGNGTVIQIDDTWPSDTVPTAEFSSINEISKLYGVVNSRKQVFAVEEETAVFLNLVDGKCTLSEIVGRMPLKYKLKNGPNSTTNLQVKYCAICSQLERQKIIKKANLG